LKIRPLSWSVTKVCSCRPSEPSASQHQATGGRRCRRAVSSMIRAVRRSLKTEIRRVAKLVTYGWGVIPVEASIAGIPFRTSLFPKDETYLLPVKVEVRRRTGLAQGDTATVWMKVERARS